MTVPCKGCGKTFASVSNLNKHLIKGSCHPSTPTQNQVTQPKIKLKLIDPIKLLPVVNDTHAGINDIMIPSTPLSLSEQMSKLETDIGKLSKDRYSYFESRVLNLYGMLLKLGSFECAKIVKDSILPFLERFDDLEKILKNTIEGTESSKKETELLKNRVEELTRETQYLKMDNLKLKDVLTNEGEDECLSISSNKFELIDRLRDDKLVSDLYKGITIEDLKKLLKNKGLPISGKKSELIDRLVAKERLQTTIISTFDSNQNQIDTITCQGNVENSAVTSTCKIDKLKRQTIPKAIRIEVWNLYIGYNKNKSICPLCLIREINIHNTDWHCSHVISDVHGGKPTLSNLRALCGTCNQSMGRMDMCEYIFTSIDDAWEAISRLQLSLQCDNWIKGDPMTRNQYRP